MRFPFGCAGLSAIMARFRKKYSPCLALRIKRHSIPQPRKKDQNEGAMRDRFSEDLIGLLPNLRRFALFLCRRSDLADDLVQITAERALAARDRFDPTTRMDAWLFRILRNAWIDHARRTTTQGQTVDVHDMPEALSVDGVAQTEAILMLRQTEAAMATLPDDQREVMLLVCIDDLSYREAAEVIGVPIGTVMSRLARARLALAEKLGIK
jgi:RNA polymerase sigma-70 factor, ECF subfamily